MSARVLTDALLCQARDYLNLARLYATALDVVARLTRERDAMRSQLVDVYEHACDECGRPLHPCASTCHGCVVDGLRAERNER